MEERRPAPIIPPGRPDPDGGREDDGNGEPDEAPETPLDEPPPTPVKDPPPDDRPRGPYVVRKAGADCANLA